MYVCVKFISIYSLYLAIIANRVKSSSESILTIIKQLNNFSILGMWFYRQKIHVRRSTNQVDDFKQVVEEEVEITKRGYRRSSLT